MSLFFNLSRKVGLCYLMMRAALLLVECGEKDGTGCSSIFPDDEKIWQKTAGGQGEKAEWQVTSYEYPFTLPDWTEC